jgi:hypothetical protein
MTAVLRTSRKRSNHDPFAWTNVQVEIGDPNAPFTCPTTHMVPPEYQLRVVIGECRDSSGRPATEGSVVRVNADQGGITSAMEPGPSAR